MTCPFNPQREQQSAEQVDHVPFGFSTGRVHIVAHRAEGADAEIRCAKPRCIEGEKHAVQREEPHVMVHHNGERISAEGQCEAASADIRRKQAGNAQIKRNGQRAAGVYAECVADEIGAIRKQICKIFISGGKQHAQHHNRQQIRHGGQTVALFQHAAVKLAAREAGQQNHRAQKKQWKRLLPAGKTELHGGTAGNQAEQKGHDFVFVPSHGQAADARVENLREK